MNTKWGTSRLAWLPLAALLVAIGCSDQQRTHVTAPPQTPQALLVGTDTIHDLWNGGPLHGAIFTTLPFGQAVNANVQYTRKIEVYLDGGPRNLNSMAAGLNDGLYVFQITDPPGKTLLSMDPARCRVVSVKGGVIEGTVPAPRIPGLDATTDYWTDNGNSAKKACHIETDDADGASVAGQHDTNVDTDPGGGVTVQMMPFLDTPNPGGVYKAWMTPVAVYLGKGGDLNKMPAAAKGQAPGYLPDPGFKNPSRQNVKTDNFKVVEKPPFVVIKKYVKGVETQGWMSTVYEFVDGGWVGAGWKPTTATFAIPFNTNVLACEQNKAGFLFVSATIDGQAATVATDLTQDEDGNPITCVNVPGVTTGTTVALVFNNAPLANAKISIAPLLATNGIYDPHALKATVAIDYDGTGTTFVSAPDGLRIDFAILSGPGTLTPAFCMTAGGTGACSTTLTSTVAGTTKVEASTIINHTTVPGVPAGQSLTIKTDGTGLNSGPAVKHWITGTLVWEKQDWIGQRLAGATFQVCRTHDYVYSTQTFTALPSPDCFTPDILDNDSRDQNPTAGVFKLTDLRLGRYTIKETIAPPNYLLDPRTLIANVIDATTVTVGPFVDNLNGRMTGGSGQVILDAADGNRFLTSGFTIHCDILLSNNLEVNWKDGAGQSRKWHITKPIQSAKCTDNPDVRPGQPLALFDTFEGTAEGTLDGVAGSWVEFVFVDAGEPGKTADLVRIKVWSGAIGASSVAMEVKGNMSITGYTGLAKIRGDIQAHLDQPHK